MKLVVGTRGSNLSLIQTDYVVRMITELFTNISIKTKVIKTTGDMSEKPLLSISAKGIFEKEIDTAIVQGDVDFAVHSMKDIPTIGHFETVIAAVPKREVPYDALVSRDRLRLSELPSGSIVGTGSPRRKAQVHHLRSDLKVEPIRGNVDTRIRKIREGLYGAVILAEAGLRRLNLTNYLSERLFHEDFTPSPGQGALAVVARKDRRNVLEILEHINHDPSMAEILSERAFLKEVGGGCKVPVGALARSESKSLSLIAAIYSPDGQRKIQVRDAGDVDAPEKLGIKVAERIRKAGGGDLLREWGDVHG